MTLTIQTKRSKHATALLAVVAACTALIGCGDPTAPSVAPDAAGAGKTVVVATTTILEDVARRLAGDDAEVRGVMRVGEDPHVYEVRPQDAVMLSGAGLVLANGFHLEATLGGVIDQVAADTHVELAEAAGIDGEDRIGSDVYAGAPDPHIWMDPTLFSRVVQQMGEALAAADPPHADAYRARATAYAGELTQLHDEITAAFAAIPRDRRVIITSHDAFNYYARAYGVEVHGVIGISTDAQPTGQQVEALRALVRDRGVRALFIETSTSPTLNNIVKKIADEAGIAIGGTLYSDSLGAPGTPGDTYLGMLRHNTEVIVAALSGDGSSTAAE